MSYSPTPVPSDPALIPEYLAQELQALSQSLQTAQQFAYLQTLHKAPTKPRVGLVVKADGTDWDPGSGAGPYMYVGSAWVPMFGAGGGSGITQLTADVTAGPGSGSQASTIVLSRPHHWSAVQGSTYETLTDAATITPTGSTNVSYLLCTSAIGATRTINVPTFTNGTASDYWAIEVEQPATGGPCAVVFASGFKWGKGELDSQPLGSTAASAVDSYFFQKKHNGTWHGNQIGQAGPTGATGATGATGSAGPTGPTGSAGVGNTSGRLTLTTGVPITTSDVTGATTIFFTPYKGNQIQLWDGAAWTTYTFTEVSVALGTLTAALPYDVFGRQVAGVLTLDFLAWASATARATAVTLQDGRYCKSGDKTRLYLGTFYTTSTTTTEDSSGGTTTQVGGKRFLWNYYNRVCRDINVIDTTPNWVYTTQTWRQAHGVTGNKVEFVIGLSEDDVSAGLTFSTFCNTNASFAFLSSIGLDSITVPNPACIAMGYNSNSGNVYTCQTPRYSGYPGVGYHYLSWMEKGADGTSGGVGSNVGAQSILTALVFN